MRITDAVFAIAENLGRIADAINYLALELAEKPTYKPAEDEEIVEAGMYNPTEDDMIEFLRQYGEFHQVETYDPYRGWTVFNGEDEDG